jgi:hypothetical protein
LRDRSTAEIRGEKHGHDPLAEEVSGSAVPDFRRDVQGFYRAWAAERAQYLRIGVM